MLQQQINSGLPIDCFGDLNSGKKLPIEARQGYTSDTPTDTVVDDILRHLGVARTCY